MSTTFEIGRCPAALSRARSHIGDGPIVDVLEQPPDVARAAVEVVDRDLAPSPRAARPVRAARTARFKVEVVERRDLAREAVDRLQVGPVAGRLDEQHGVDERQHVGERRAGLGLVGSSMIPRVLGAEADLVLGQDHPVGDLAAHLAPVELEPVRQHRARQRDADGGADAEVPGAADDRRAARPRRRRPSSPGAGRRSGASRPRARCPTRKRPRLPPSSSTPRRSIPSTSAVATESRVASSSSGISIAT